MDNYEKTKPIEPSAFGFAITSMEPEYIKNSKKQIITYSKSKKFTEQENLLKSYLDDIEETFQQYCKLSSLAFNIYIIEIPNLEQDEFFERRTNLLFIRYDEVKFQNL